MAKSAPKPAAKPSAKSAKPAPKPAAKSVAAKAAPTPATKFAPAPPTAKPTPPPAPPAPKPILRTTGLSPREQKLQALRAKLAHQSSGAKPQPGASAQSFSAKSFTGKKTPFQRKAV